MEGCLSSSAHPADLSLARKNGQRGEDGKGDAGRPRQFTLISRPVLNHPGCEERPGYVRGTYESVEFVRELPLSRSPSTLDVPPMTESSSSTSAAVGALLCEETAGQSSVGGGEVAQDHVVDWIMITRSDPGGSVPKWMVERGTPGGIARDAEKFLNTILAADATAEAQPTGDACENPSQRQQQQQQNPSSPESIQGVIETEGSASAAAGEQQADVLASAETLPTLREDSGGSNGQTGYLTGALDSVALGMASLAQSAIYPTPLQTSPPENELSLAANGNGDDSDSDSETASTTWSFATCLDSSHDASADPTPPQKPSRTPSVSSTATGASSAGAGQTAEERALAQFLREKQKLDAKLKKEAHKQTERERKMAEKHLKNMDKQERKYRRALAKANEKRAKDEDKRQRGAHKRERDEKWRRREIDELKKVVEGLTRENLQLRQRVDDLEAARREVPAMDDE